MELIFSDIMFQQAMQASLHWHTHAFDACFTETFAKDLMELTFGNIMFQQAMQASLH